MTKTLIPQLTEAQWTQLYVDAFPVPWSADTARQTGGNLYALFWSMAANMMVLNSQLVYAFNATRIDTATDNALDNVAKDYYGDQLPRLPGESDESYRSRIKAGFFIPYTTKEAFLTALTRLLGRPPRLISPWNPSETAAYGKSYYGVDLPDKGLSGIYGAPGTQTAAAIGMPYQVGIEAVLPPITVKKYGVLWGYNVGAAYDIYTGIYSPAGADQFFGPQLVDALIKRIRAAGITVWRKYLNTALVDYIIVNSRHVPSGTSQYPLTVQPIAGSYWVLCSGDWMSAYYVPQPTALGFTLGSTTAAPPGGGQLNSVIVPFTVPDSGRFSLNAGDTTLSIPLPAAQPGGRLANTPTWGTSIWITSIDADNINIEFNVAAPDGGRVGYLYLPDLLSAIVPIDEDATEFTYTLQASLTGRAVPFCLLNYNAQSSVKLAGNVVTVKMNRPAPAGSFAHVGVFSA